MWLNHFVHHVPSYEMSWAYKETASWTWWLPPLAPREMWRCCSTLMVHVCANVQSSWKACSLYCFREAGAKRRPRVRFVGSIPVKMHTHKVSVWHRKQFPFSSSTFNQVNGDECGSLEHGYVIIKKLGRVNRAETCVHCTEGLPQLLN